jgi:hypothetical protein
MQDRQRYDIRERNGKFEVWERLHEGNPPRSVHKLIAVFDSRAEAEQEIERLRNQP